MLTELEIPVTTQDGTRLALWRVRDDAANPPVGTSDVLLTHGTFSDKRICLGMAKHLASLGYCCWILEWRGHGSSGASATAFNFDTVAQCDVMAALDHLEHRQGIRRLHCVAHSGGGLVLTMCLTRHPRLVHLVDRAVLFACQALHAAPSRPRKWLLRSLRLASRLHGSIPGRRLGVGIQDESYFMMQQWYDWNISERFIGLDGFDYLANMRQLKLPVLSMSGAADRLIAPPAACRKYLEAFGGDGNRSIECGLSSGFSLDYAHANVLHSRAAMSEIWPMAVDWLAGATTPSDRSVLNTSGEPKPHG